jgi:hypothetical protein
MIWFNPEQMSMQSVKHYKLIFDFFDANFLLSEEEMKENWKLFVSPIISGHFL